MEAMEEEVAIVTTTTTTTHVNKGKRTKRQRVQSPIPDFAGLTTNSCSADDGGGEDEYCTSSNNNDQFQDITEDEDHVMANCLILLKQGNWRDPSQNQDSNLKFNGRKFLETGTDKIGRYYVYECKTCNRTFPSFQALGGHRASHKKPKATHINNEEKRHFTLSSDEEEGHFKNLSSLSLQLTSTNNHHNKVAKIHECSICGAEFMSGQALGGHMRRHRGMVVGSGNNTSLSLTTMVIESEEPKKARNVLSLDFDLNLPAPAEDHDKLALPSKQQQEEEQKKSPLVLSGPALVDCHY